MVDRSVQPFPGQKSGSTFAIFLSLGNELQVDRDNMKFKSTSPQIGVYHIEGTCTHGVPLKRRSDSLKIFDLV